MITVGVPVRASHGYGTVTGLGWVDDNGVRWWRVRWDHSPASIAHQSVLIDVEREEWLDALAGVESDQRCPSRAHGRECAMRRGHRTRRHRNCEISWETPA